MSAVRRAMVTALSALLAFGSVAVVEAQPALAKPAKTIKKVVRPVHRDGTPVRGYRVVVEDHDSEYGDFECYQQSPVSVSSGVDACGITADSTIACWRSTTYSVLCLRDPRVKKLVRIYYNGSFAVQRAYKRVAPIGLDLRRRGKCSVRIGGAWDRPKQHPSWFGYYSCNSKKYGFSAVYGPGKRRDGIIRGKRTWRVDLLTYHRDYGQGPIRRDVVRRAYYVGTAR